MRLKITETDNNNKRITEHIDPGPDKYPFLIERRLKGYNTAALLFAMLGAFSWVATKSIYGVGLGLFVSLAIFLLGFAMKKKISAAGFEHWRFEVVELTKLTPFNIKPTGFFASAVDGPYAGKMCHISMSGADVAPTPGQVIELCVPGGVEASLVRDVYYIPEYYGMSFVTEEA